MRSPLTPLLFWTPRILGILLALFVAVFALDVFSEGRAPGATFLALLMHLIPALLVASVVAIAWKWELAGGILFFGLAALYVVTTGGRQHWSAYALLSGIPALLGILFLLDWAHRSSLKAHA